jgi:hypothetical protein
MSAGLAGAEETPVQPAGVCEMTFEPAGPVQHPAAYDCAPRDDTGYVQGNSFAITVFQIDGKPVELESGNAFWVMREAAAADGVDIHINSGFRTMDEQQYLYNCYVNCNCNNCNLAATPGYSNHQSGHAFDLNTTGYGGAVYNWLAANAANYGFANTVSGEHWHWEWWEGGPGGGICTLNQPPRGRLDAADCEGIRGWALDPDQPDAASDVHLYFDGEAGSEDAIGIAVSAGELRPDLCEEPGASCEHGYTVPVPMSLRDGQEHTVYAYAIDLEGEQNTPLSDQTFSCPPPRPDGARRHVDPQAMENWKFSEFTALAPIGDPEIAGLPEWLDLDPTPHLVTTDEPDAPVWLIDVGMRRHVPNLGVAGAWNLDLSTAEVLTPDELDAWPEWLALRDAPLLVRSSDGTVYLVDDFVGPDDPPGAGGTDGTTDGGDDGDDGDSTDTEGSEPDTDGPGLADEEPSDGGCACRTTDSRHLDPRLGLALLGLWIRRRRRRRTASRL